MKTESVDYEKIPVPRNVYVELMKSCQRLRALQLAGKKRQIHKVYFCYECGAVVENPKSKARILCLDCKRTGKILQEATHRANTEKRNKLIQQRRKKHA